MSIETEVNAKKKNYIGEDAWQIIADSDKVFVASGTKILEYTPVTADKEDILKKITGRTGNLRAPALKRENVFYIGYNDTLYGKF